MTVRLWALFGALVVTAADSCGGDLSKLSVGDSCKESWSTLRPLLRPTQSSVGYAWVFRIFLKDMGSKGDAQDEMDGKVIPVVLGAGGVAYIIDHHHHLSALDLSGHHSVDVTLFVSCDFSSMGTDLWDALQSRGFAYLFGRPSGAPDALPTPISPRALPSTIEFREGNLTMADDRWRALSGFSRKVKSCDGCSSAVNKNDGCRAYDRVCAPSGASTPFFEYRWAYLYDVASAVNTSLWPSEGAARAFGVAYGALHSPTPREPAKDVDDWGAAAALLIPLARGAPAGTFRVPTSMGAAMAGPLPGYRKGMEPFPHDDPDCDLPAC